MREVPGIIGGWALLLIETTSLEDAEQREMTLPEGCYEVRLFLVRYLTQEELTGLHDYLLVKRFEILGNILQSITGLYMVEIKYKKDSRCLISHLPDYVKKWVTGIAILTDIALKST